MMRWSFLKTLTYALEGLNHAFRTQANMRFHVFAAVIVLLASCVLLKTSTEWAAILLTIGLVFATELINTSIEALVDLLSPEIQARAKVAKDVAAAAVLVSSIVAIGVGLTLLGARLIEFFWPL